MTTKTASAPTCCPTGSPDELMDAAAAMVSGAFFRFPADSRRARRKIFTGVKRSMAAIH